MKAAVIPITEGFASVFQAKLNAAARLGLVPIQMCHVPTDNGAGAILLVLVEDLPAPAIAPAKQSDAGVREPPITEPDAGGNGQLGEPEVLSE